jgi:broad specificity phosphatase PhoE
MQTNIQAAPPSRPLRLWVVRHGQSSGNVARDKAESEGHELIELATRDADVPLSTLGQRQAQGLANWFAEQPEAAQPTLLMTSPYVRSVQTCAAVADVLRIPRDRIRVDERLREKEFGILDRYTRYGIKHKFPELDAQRRSVGKFYFRPPGGESWCDVILRLRSVYDDIKIDASGQRVLIIAHQVIVNCLRYIVERMDEATIVAIDREGDVPNCGLTEYCANAQSDDLTLVQTNFVPPAVAAAGTTEAADEPAGPK